MARRDKIKPKNKKPLIVICSEGGNNTSEKIYFSNFKSRNVRIQFSSGNSTDPCGMLDDLKKYIINEDIDNEDNVSIFLIIDTDLDNDRINKIKELESECEKRNIKIITSAPTFEIWYLMHYRKNGLRFNSSIDVKKELIKVTNGLYKESLNMYPKIFDSEESAISISKNIENNTIKNNEEFSRTKRESTFER